MGNGKHATIYMLDKANDKLDYLKQKMSLSKSKLINIAVAELAEDAVRKAIRDEKRIEKLKTMTSRTNNEYKKLVKHILDNGTYQQCRNGEQLIIPSYSFTLDFMVDNPLISLRKMYYKGIFGEFETLISKEQLTNVSQFEANGCNYWKEWSGPKGELNLDYYNMLHPQLEDIIEQIKATPDSRRHVISLWNHENVKSGKLSLPCCWYGMTFSVIDSTLHMIWTQRSVDTMVGLPSDIYLAYLFMGYIADECNLVHGTCMFSLSNVHIYSEHIEGAKELLTRTDADKDKPLKFELKA
jgi:thymidylate synthase